jgi:type IV pilus assembly protein PilC
MVFVVPRFEQIFAGMLKGQPLPALTRGVLAVSTLVQHNLLLSAALVIVVGASFALFRRTARGERVLDHLAIRLPVCGDILLKSAVARFTRTFGTLLASGVPMLDALRITRETSGNARVAHALALVHDRVRDGGDVASSLTETEVFPEIVASMTEVGEQTGALPAMLARIADIYDEEVDHRVAALTSLLEPLLIVFLAAVVGTIVIALFLPIVSIIQHLQ